MAGQERARAARIVHAVIDQGRSLDRVIGADDDPLIRALAYETLRWHVRLEAIALALMDKRPRARDIIVLRLIEVGLAQLIYFQTADHAAINETVAAAPRVKQARAKGLINAVLRRFQRERNTLESTLDDSPALRHACPDWLHARIETDWADQAESILRANNTRAPMALRINRRKISREDYLNRLADAGIAAKASPFGDHGLVLESPVDVKQLPGFAEGEVSVQDMAAQQAAPLLQLEGTGLRALDACAAPGGKTGHMAEGLGDQGVLVALDNAEERQQLTRENLSRLGHSATVLVSDAGDPRAWWDEQAFDRILLDAPCSGTGVIRRHPDIKSLRRESDIPELARTQRHLLERLWPTLKPGGLLLYATCSILKQENEDQISTFLADTADAVDETPETQWGESRPAGRQILPGNDDMDGFYYAAIRKQSS